MRQAISNTAKYGDVTVGPMLIDDAVKNKMRYILSRIQNGTFAKEWILENQAGRPVFNKLLEKDNRHLIEEFGGVLRSMMSWLNPQKSAEPAKHLEGARKAGAKPARKGKKK
jgi:ketol-acid reductoisomerase